MHDNFIIVHWSTRKSRHEMLYDGIRSVVKKDVIVEVDGTHYTVGIFRRCLSPKVRAWLASDTPGGLTFHMKLPEEYCKYYAATNPR